MSQCAFVKMPLHLIARVFLELDDVQSLGAAIISHTSFHAAFKEQRLTIIVRVLENQISPNVMLYAEATCEAALRRQGILPTASQRRRRRRGAARLKVDSIIEGVTCAYSTPDSDLPRRSLRSMLELSYAHAVARVISQLSHTHMLVEHFTQRFLSDTIPLAEELHGESHSCSAHEIFRIQRALYRYQLFCELVNYSENSPENEVDSQRSEDEDRYSWQHHPFFGLYSPWINEQLACIHDYLERVLSEAFDEVAAHDIEWGARSVNWNLRGRCNKHKEAYLLHGLPFLFRLERTSNYDQRVQLFKSLKLTETSHGLATALSTEAAPYVLEEDRPQGLYALGDWRRRDFRCLRRKETEEVDLVGSAPFRMWLTAHENNFAVRRETVFRDENSALRRYGYVIWDFPQGERTSETCRNRFRSLRSQGGSPGSNELQDPKEQMIQSWNERARIFARGGRGYWSHGDLSRVIWGVSSGESKVPSDIEMAVIGTGSDIGIFESIEFA